MDLTQDNYTKDEVAKILEGYDTKISDLTKQVEGIDEKDKTIETLTKSNLATSIKLEMQKNGLDEDLFDLVADSKDLDTATKKINKLLTATKKKDIDDGYKPSDHNKSTNTYQEAEKQGNVEGMLKSKFSKLFQ